MQELSAELEEKLGEIAGKDAFVKSGDGEIFYAFYPSSAEELSCFAALCFKHRLPMSARSGENVPDKRAINVFFDRMDKAIAVDPVAETITVQAGCTFETARRAADDAGFLFPLCQNAAATARVGGKLASNVINAGVLRYGTPKELTLGLRVVLPDGTIKDSLENYATAEADAMKNLFVGSRGGIGFITAAVLRLHPKPLDVRRMLCLCDGLSGVRKLFELSRHSGATLLTGFDVFSQAGMNEITANVRDLEKPAAAPWYVLIEFSSAVVNERVGLFLEELKKEAVRKSLIRDAVTSKYPEDAENLARLGLGLSCLSRSEDAGFFREAALPVSKTADVLERLGIQAAYAFPKAVIVPLARMGEGGLFLSARFPEAQNANAALTEADNLFKLFDTLVCQAGGMCAGRPADGSAALKAKGEFADVIRALKSSFDPYNLMTPV